MRVLGTAEVLQMIDIPRSKLYYLEQKGYISPRKKVIGEKEYRFYSPQDVEKISLIWVHLKRGLRYRVAYEKTREELSNSGRPNNRMGKKRVLKTMSLFLFLFCAAPVRPQSAVPAPQVQQQPVVAPVPTSPGLSQPGYLLGPGDTVRVTVWTGNEYLQENLTVAPDGTIFVPFFVNKLVNIAGQTSAQLRDLIQTELQLIFQRPVVQLITIGFESQKAFLVGEVAGAGHFPIFGNTRILDFVVQHGGFSAKANLAEVGVTRGDGQKLTVNVYDIVLKGDQSQNILVTPGDMVFVPSLETVAKRYFILGEVRSPQVLHSATDLNLLEAISRAGTLAVTGEAAHVFVVRQGEDKTAEVMDINFKDLYKKGDFSRNIPLKSGDIVFVPKNRRTRVSDVLTAVTPVMTFVRDSVFLLDILRR